MRVLICSKLKIQKYKEELQSLPEHAGKFEIGIV